MVDLHIWSRNLENTAVLHQLYIIHSLVSQKSLWRLGGPLGCIVPVLPDWWKDWCVCEEREFAILNMSLLRWQHCQGKSIFRLNSFDNVPLSVSSPSSKNERTRSEPVEKGFWSLQQCFFFFSFSGCSCAAEVKGKREKWWFLSPAVFIAQEGERLTAPIRWCLHAGDPTQFCWIPCSSDLWCFWDPFAKKSDNYFMEFFHAKCLMKFGLSPFLLCIGFGKCHIDLLQVSSWKFM